jgi:UDP-glucose 4-epimerase
LKHVLLTGGAGFVGANLARALVGVGHEVSLLLRRESQRWRLQDVNHKVGMHHADLGSQQEVERVVAAIQPDWVFHLATYGAYPEQTDLDKMVRTNIVGTMNLVRACVRVGCEVFVNTGSSSEYGYKSSPPSETAALDPNSHYAVTKAAATLFCRHTARRERLRLPTLRLYSVYGPYEERTRLLPRLITHGLEGSLPPLAAPDTARDFVYIDDVVDAYLRVATVPGQELGAVYNVGTGRQTTLREAVDTTRSFFRLRAQPQWATFPQRPWDTRVWVADIQRIRQTLGWSPLYTFERGLAATVRWWLANAELWPYYKRGELPPADIS